MVKPECFYTRFGEQLKKKSVRAKEYKLRVVNCGKLNKGSVFGFLLASLSSQVRMLFIRRLRKGTSHKRLILW